MNTLRMFFQNSPKIQRPHQQDLKTSYKEELTMEAFSLNLCSKKITGIDDLNPGITCPIAPLIVKSPTSFLNKFKTGKVPDDLKISLIAPVYKSEDEYLFSNYIHIYSCFTVSEISYKKQFGFRLTNSTETARLPY